MASEDRIKHLEFIQATINRQATNSFTIKGWSITVSSALYAYTASHLSWWLAVVAIVPGVGFGLLDAYYLMIERRFRKLYDDVAAELPGIGAYSMDIGRYSDAKDFPKCTRRDVWKSPSMYLLYGGTVIVGVFLLIVAIFQSDGAKDFAQCISDAL